MLLQPIPGDAATCLLLLNLPHFAMSFLHFTLFLALFRISLQICSILLYPTGPLACIMLTMWTKNWIVHGNAYTWIWIWRGISFPSSRNVTSYPNKHILVVINVIEQFWGDSDSQKLLKKSNITNNEIIYINMSYTSIFFSVLWEAVLLTA